MKEEKLKYYLTNLLKQKISLWTILASFYYITQFFLISFSFLVLILLLVEWGHPVPQEIDIFWIYIDYHLFIIFFIHILLKWILTVKSYPKIKIEYSFPLIIIDIFIILFLILGPNIPRFYSIIILTREIIIIVWYLWNKLNIIEIISNFYHKGPQIIAITFLGIILLGSFLLSMPISTTSGHGTSFIDALFTATSATCVTGLVVLDTKTHFNLFGQLVILLLIQTGGLGIMTLSLFTALITGKKMKLKEKVLMLGILDIDELESIKNSIYNIVKFTFIIEGVGALILSVRWYLLSKNIPNSIYLGIFHSVSAFCNAGFTLFSNNLITYYNDIIIVLVISFLIILGGLGFTVIEEIISLMRGKKQKKRLTLHTKVVLIITLLLIFIGSFIIFFTEFDHTMKNMSFKDRVLSSYFQSVTTRTAGFNTVDFAFIANSTLFLMIILMFIGGSPGGTAGGIKTSTFGIAILTVKSIIQGRRSVEVSGRVIPKTTIAKSLSIIISSLGFIVFLLFLLIYIEEERLLNDNYFKQLLFEAVSAFGTVGLSLGITPYLSSLGKFIIILLMFIGRIGPLTLALAIGVKEEPSSLYTYPEGKILVG